MARASQLVRWVPLGALALVLIAETASLQRSRSEGQATVRRTTALIAARVLGTQSELIALTGRASDLVRRRPSEASLVEGLTTRRAAVPAAAAIGIYDKTGRLQVQSLAAAGPRQLPATLQADPFGRAMMAQAGEDAMFGPPLQTTAGAVHYLPFGRPIPGSDGIDGYVLGLAETSSLLPTVDETMITSVTARAAGARGDAVLLALGGNTAAWNSVTPSVGQVVLRPDLVAGWAESAGVAVVADLFGPLVAVDHAGAMTIATAIGFRDWGSGWVQEAVLLVSAASLIAWMLMRQATRLARTARRAERRGAELQALVDALPAAVVYRDGDGRIVFANHEFLTALGAVRPGAADPAGIAGLTFDDIARDLQLKPADRRLVDESDAAIAKARSALRPREGRRLEHGAPHPVPWFPAGLLMRHVTALVPAIDPTRGPHDLIDLYLDETTLTRSRQQMRAHRDTLLTVIDAMPAVVVAIDDLGRVVLANRRLADLVGQAVHEVVGRSLPELAAAAADPAAAALFPVDGSMRPMVTSKRAIAGGTIETSWMLQVFPLDTGLARWMPADDSAIILAGPSRLLVAVDVSDLAAAQQRLKVSEQRYRDVVDHIGEAVLTVEPGDLVVSMGNAPAFEMFGGPDEIVGANLLEVLGAHQGLAYLAQSWKPGEAVAGRAVAGVPPRPLTVTALVHGDGTQATVVLRDLSADLALESERRAVRQRLEAEVAAATLQARAANEQLQQLLEGERLITRKATDFLAIVAHELKNPLASIAMIGRTLERHGDRLTPADIRSRGENLLAMVVRLERLMATTAMGLQAEAQSITAKAVPVELDELLDECRQEQLLISPGRRILIGGEPGLCVVSDRDLLRHIVANLLSNAIKYSQDDIDLVIVDNGAHIGILVVDRGIGLDEGEAGRIWERHWRSEKAKAAGISGLGVGLALVAEFARLIGASIEVSSKAGEGTTMTIWLQAKTGREDRDER